MFILIYLPVSLFIIFLKLSFIIFKVGFTFICSRNLADNRRHLRKREIIARVASPDADKSGVR